MAWCLALVALVCGVLAPGTAVARVPGGAAVVSSPGTRVGDAALGVRAGPSGWRAALGLPAGPSRWRSPLRPLLVRRFFEPPPEPWLPGHRGVDLAGRRGQLVLAAGSGTVTFAGPLAGRGVVTVSHGTLRTTYEPVEPLVAVGDTVSAGTPIAKLDAGHRPTTGFEARLHWGLLRGRTYLDPLLLLGPRRSRLLPVWSGPLAGRWERGAAEPPGDAASAPRGHPRGGSDPLAGEGSRSGSDSRTGEDSRSEPDDPGRAGPANVAVGSSAAAAGAIAAVAVARSRRRRPP